MSDGFEIPIPFFAVYVLKDASDEVVYVGKSVRNFVYGRVGAGAKKYRATSVKIYPCSSEAEAGRVEYDLIQRHAPSGNWQYNPNRSSFSPKKQNEIVEAIENGFTISEIAELLGAPLYAIRRIATNKTGTTRKRSQGRGS